MQTVLRNVRRFTAEGRTVDVRYEGQQITAVSPTGAAPDTHEHVIEGHGRLACPGFVNAHTHLPMILFRGIADGVPLDVWLEDHIWPLERQLTPEDVYWCTLLALAEAIRCGTVAVADMYFHCDEIGRAVEESGLRAVLSNGMIADTMDARGQSELSHATAVVKRWEGAADGRIRTALSPHAVYTCGEEIWRAAVEAADTAGVRIHTHLSESRTEVESWIDKTGESPVATLDRIGVFSVPTLAAHCVHVSDDDIAILAERGVAVAHCPKSNAKLGNGVAPVGAMRAAGVTVAIGTDGAASNDRLNMLGELQAACLLQRAATEDPMQPTAKDAVAMATDAGRVALGLPPADVQPGDAADIVLIDTDRTHTTPHGDPAPTLVFASGASDVTDVIVDGRHLMKDGVLLTIDEERVQSEVNRLLRRLNH